MRDRGMEGFGGLMARSIRDIGMKVNSKVKEYLRILVETFIEVNGWMDFLMGKVSCFKLQSTTSKLLAPSVQKAQNFGPTDQNTSEISSSVKNMEMESFFGKIKVLIMDSGKTVK